MQVSKACCLNDAPLTNNNGEQQRNNGNNGDTHNLDLDQGHDRKDALDSPR